MSEVRKVQRDHIWLETLNFAASQNLADCACLFYFNLHQHENKSSNKYILMPVGSRNLSADMGREIIFRMMFTIEI